MMPRIFLSILCFLAAANANADQKLDLITTAERTTVYLEVRDAQGGVLNTGSGFVVSQDGYVTTVAHLKVGPNQTLWGSVGMRGGVWYPLQNRERDEANDVAVWQLPQSPACRYAIPLSTTPMSQLDQVMAFGFPGTSGLTPSVLNILNLQTQRGFAKSDGYLEGGFSGGPVLNQSGAVVGIVHGGGQPGTENNEIIPIAPARVLLEKRGVKFGIDTSQPFSDGCYTSCRAASHGIEAWKEVAPWAQNSGWLGGGNNQTDICNGIAAAIQASNNADYVEVTEKGETSKKDVFGRVEYKYFCKGNYMKSPVYIEKRSSACSLWN